MPDPVEAPALLENFQPFGHSFRENPYAFYPALQANSPLAIEVEGKPAVAVSRYAHVRAVLSDFKLYSSVKPKGVPGMERVDYFNGFPVMVYADPPQHTYLRRLVGAAFSAAKRAALKARAKEISDELLAGLGDHPTFDAVRDLAYPFARRLLFNSFMGVPDGEETVFINYVNALPLLDTVQPGGEKPKAFLDAWKAGTEYCALALERARTDRTENIVRLIAEASDDGKITMDEVMATMVALFAAGHATSASTMASALVNLIRHPDVAERIRHTPELAERHFEETLRLAPALTQAMRFATQDMTFEGLVVAKDTPFYVMIAAACHDPEVFPEPYRFDIDRPNNTEHLAFGAGVHTCIGNVIARAVFPPFIADVAKRYPDLRLSDPAAPLEYNIGNPRLRHLDSVRLAA
jgi:cytochrome P450